MRSFLLIANQATTEPFNLNGLPNAGRMDLVCRCIAQSLVISHGIRKNTQVLILLLGPPDPPKVLRIEGSAVRSLSPDERNIAGIIRKALGVPTSTTWRESGPGVFVAQKDLAPLLKECTSPIVYLCENGADIRTIAHRLSDNLFILGDHQGLTPSQGAIVDAHAHHTVSISPTSLQADQCITVVQNELDRVFCRIE
jgi:tRNA (pseudouridine54-N1)-methyltransferase